MADEEKTTKEIEQMGNIEGREAEDAREEVAVRPKEYMLPSCSQTDKQTCKEDITLGERQKFSGSLHLKQRANVRNEISTTHRDFWLPRGKTPVRPASITCSTRSKASKYTTVTSRSMSITYLEELVREPPDNVAEALQKRRDDFVQVLKSRSKDEKLIATMFALFAKITKAEGDNLIHLSSVLRETLFVENIAAPYLLSLIGRGTDNVDTVRHAVSIFRYIIEHSYTSVTSLFCAFTALNDLIEEIRASDLCTPDIKAELDDFDQIRSKIKTMRLRQRKKARTKEDKMLPPDSFRLINISPTADELLTNRAPFLRKNKDIGSYNDLEHYLDVQFRLLREDFVAPLRESIDEFKNNMHEVQNKTRKVKDIRIYSGVKIAGTTTTNEGICHVLTFDASKTQRVKWEYSKRLIYGSLLCLSYDSFQTVFLATVTNRDPSDLKLGMLDVKFMCELETVREIADKEFIMAESSTYFEAYRHNLRALQLIKDLPFSQYIVECRDEIKPPAYLIRDDGKVYDLSVLEKDFVDDKRTSGFGKRSGFGKDLNVDRTLNVEEIKHDKALENVDILNESSWPSYSKLGLDESQHNAFKNALTHEFSITQGPPGTGKTFIGLKVARALLANKALWSGEQKQPLLLVCYTNHALDQFLCGIHDFFKGDIVRIGGRSANEEMQKHGINTMYTNLSSDVRAASSAARETADITEGRINHLKRLIYRLDREFVMTGGLLKYMGRFQAPLEKGFEKIVRHKRLKIGSDDSELTKLDPIDLWLNHGFYQAKTNIKVLFAGTDLVWKTSSRKLETNNKGNQPSNHATSDTASQYYEQTGCISKDIIKLSLLFSCASNEHGHVRKKPQADISNSVFYQDIEPMNETLRDNIRDIWSISFLERLGLYKSWVEDLKKDLTESLNEYEENYIECCQAMKQADRDKHIDALRQADVIGMTTTGAAKHYEVLQSVKPKIVIVEEAAEVLEGHIVTSLSDECEHLILIGDHKQLRPSPTVYQLAKKYKLDLSLFERMINNKVNHKKLEIQHRMRPEIANIIRLIYPYLKDHEIVLDTADIRGVSKNVYFITHKQCEEEDEEMLSHLNKHEAEFIVGLCRYLLKQEYKTSQITVLTTYRAQMFYLQKLMPKNGVFGGINITVVDNYQGEENEIVLLSLVRSNTSKKVGFLKTENRINVALSRARNGLYVIGNMDNFADASETWAKVVTLLKKEGQIGPAIPLFCRNHSDRKLCAQTMKDFGNAPEGGCNLNCEARLECGHACELKCHVYDTDHKVYMCEKQCTRLCPNAHPCFKKCYENCDDCQIPVVKTIPECGHEQTIPCCQCPEDWECTAPCENKCENGHQCEKLCHENCGNCLFEVVKIVPKCGHEQTMPCFKNPLEWKCKEDCGRICQNGHKCNKMCYEDCKLCDVIFQRRLSKCGHDQLIPCFIDENEWKCNAYCERKCNNNHLYRGLCSEKCTIEITKEMPQCGHLQTMPCHVEPCDWKCLEPCDGKLNCGHECPSVCSDTTSHNSHCTKIKKKYIFSWLSMKDKCKKDCESVLECGHKYPLKCWQTRATYCRDIVTVVLDDCGHSNDVECYRQKTTNMCFKPCEILLECGHQCKKKCCEPHTIICEELVLKGKSCGHTLSVQCHEDVESVTCTKPCEFRLECGHLCRRKCSEPHSEVCTSEIERILPCCKRTVHVPCTDPSEKIECPFPCKEKLECGHSCANKCGDPHTDVCQVLKDKTLSCGHVQNLHCGVNVDTFKCFLRCTTILACGHGCRNRCVEPHTPKCEEIVNYECNYGHRATAPCFRIYTELGAQCYFDCRRKLACGHICSGTCFECRGGVLHKACTACPLPDLQNHLSSQMSRQRIPCLAKCQNRCDHMICEKLCFEPCAEDGNVQWPCEEKCNAQCEHFYCQKRSFKQKSYEFCSDAYEIFTSIAENMNQPRDLKQRTEIKKSHRSCSALIDPSVVEPALKHHIKGRNKRLKEISETTCLKIASKLHEYEEKQKLNSQFHAIHAKLHERLVSLESMLEAMDRTTDLYKIYKERLSFNRENFNNWLHFQKQGYKDLEKEIERLERMARTILQMLKDV